MIIRELLTVMGVEYDPKGAEQADRSISGLLGKARGLAAALGGGFVAVALKQFVTDLVQTGDEVAKTAAKLGVGTDELQELQYAAKLTGVEVNQLRMGYQRFIRRTAEAAKGTGEAKDTLRELGIQLKDVNGRLRPSADLLNDVADALASTEDEGEKVRIAFKLFDSEGVALVNTLKGGSAALEDMKQQARDTGGIMREQLLRDAEATADAMLRWDFTMQGLRNTIGDAVLRGVTKMLDKTGQWLRAFIRLAEGTTIVEQALKVLSTASAIAAVAFLAPWLPMIAKFAAIGAGLLVIAVLLDEINVLFSGGKTLIGEWMDKLGGQGTAQQFVDSHKAGMQVINDLWRDSIKLLGEFADEMETRVNDSFILVKLSAESLGFVIDDVFGAGTLKDVKSWASETFSSLIPIFRLTEAINSLLHNGKPILPFHLPTNIDELGEDVKGVLEDLTKDLHLQAPFGIDSNTFSGATFTEQRDRKRTAGRGVGARLLTGPDFGQANAERVVTAPVSGAGATTVNHVRGGDVNVTVQGNADRRDIEGLKATIKQEVDAAARLTVEAMANEVEE